MLNNQHIKDLKFDRLVDCLPDEIRELLEGLKGLRERPDFHPEENAFEHVKIVTERLIQTGDMDLVMTGIFHDIGKQKTARINPKSGWPMSPGHDKFGAKMAGKYRDAIVLLGADPDNVIEMCGEHMRIKQMSQMRNFKQQQIKDLKTFKKLEIFTRADDMLTEFVID